MRWTELEFQRFETRRSAENLTSTASIRKRAGRKATRAACEPSELSIHMSLAGHLRNRAAANVFWAHYPAGEIRDVVTASKLKAMGTRAGVPDFLLIIDGRTYGLELKRHDGRLSPEQRECHAAIEAAGGLVHTAHSIDEALTVLSAWGAFVTLKPARQIERIAAHG